jgi:hypothetical protein
MDLNKDNMTAVDFIIQRLAKNGILHSSDIAEAKSNIKNKSYERNYIYLNGNTIRITSSNNYKIYC